MDKRVLALCVTAWISSPAVADWISADDFAQGENVTQITEGVTLGWLKSTTDLGRTSTDVYINDFVTASGHQHFGGADSAGTYDLTPHLFDEANGSPNFHDYSALQITFAQSVRSFGFKGENNTSSPFAVFLYDSTGNYLGYEYSGPNENRGVAGDTANNTFSWGLDYEYTFDYDVSSILIGGASDAGYVYALNLPAATSVPEPSIFLLFLSSLGLLGLQRYRNNKK